MSKQSFADLGASSAVVDALRAEGITEPFPVQQLVMPDVRAGRDVLVKSPTGSGKTLAFGIPMVDLMEAEDPRPSALVVCPTRELAGQIVEDLRPLAHARALSIAAVYGGAGHRAPVEARPPRPHPRGHPRPARGPARAPRLQPRPRPHPGARRGRPHARHGLPARPWTASSRALPRERQTLFFSATLEGSVLKVADSYTHDARRHEHVAPSEQRADVTHRFLAVTSDSKLDALVGQLRREDSDRNLVFVRTKHGADRLVKRLRARKIDAHRHAREQVAVPARAGARELLLRRGGHARGHRRRSPRARHRPRRPRDQLRSARPTRTATCTASGAPAVPAAPGSAPRS